MKTLHLIGRLAQGLFAITIFFLAFAGLLHWSVAHATKPKPQGQEQEQHQGQQQGQYQHLDVVNDNANVNTNTTNNSVTNNNSADAGAQASASQTQGNEQNVNISEVHPDDIRIKNTPNAYAPTVIPTASCLNGIGVGGSVPGIGLSIGAGKRDRECDLRETARMFYAFGMRGTAIQLLCQSEAARENLGDQCGSESVQRERVTTYSATECDERETRKCEAAGK